MLRTLPIYLLFCTYVAPAQWTSLGGPVGTNVTCFGRLDSVLFAGTLAGLHASSDGGVRWSTRDPWLSNQNITAVRGIGSMLVVGAGTSLFRSDDAGAHWIDLTPGLTAPSITDLTGYDSTIVACNWNGLWYSNDRGSTWSLYGGLPSGEAIQSVVWNAGRLVAGAASSGIFTSDDSGGTWVNRHPTTTVNALVMSGQTGFAATSAGVLRSVDGGDTWSGATNGLPASSFRTVAMVGTAVFAAAPGVGVFRSSNGGFDWDPVTMLPDTPVQALFSDGGSILAGTAAGVFRSEDGVQWTESSAGLPRAEVRSLLWHGTRLLQGGEAGVWVSDDSASTWRPMSFGLADRAVRALHVGASHLIAGTVSGLYRMPLTDSVWTRCDQGFTDPYIESIGQIGPAILVGTNWGGIYRTTDDGSTWAHVASGRPFAFATLDSTVFVANELGVHSSEDSGITWTWRSSGVMFGAGRAIVSARGVLFAGSESGDGVIASTDRGVTWTPRTDGLSNWFIQALGAAGEHVFVGTTVGAQVIHKDSSTWRTVTGDLADVWFRQLKRSGSSLYAATSIGAFHRPLAGMIGSVQDPEVSSDSSRVIGPSSVRVFGTVTPHGVPCSSLVEWWSSEDPLRRSNSIAVGSGTTAVLVSDTLADLVRGRSYSWRFVVISEGTSWYGATRSVTVPATPPGLVVLGADSTGPGTVLVQGIVQTQGLTTIVRVEYGTQISYGLTQQATLMAGAVAETVSVILTDIEPAVTYHWRMVAENQDGSVESDDHTFIIGAEPVFAYPFRMERPRPYPASGFGIVRFSLDRDSFVELAAFDLRGRRVATLWEGMRAAGLHEVSWTCPDWSSGMYIIRFLRDGDHAAERFMIVR